MSSPEGQKTGIPTAETPEHLRERKKPTHEAIHSREDLARLAGDTASAIHTNTEAAISDSDLRILGSLKSLHVDRSTADTITSDTDIPRQLDEVHQQMTALESAATGEIYSVITENEHSPDSKDDSIESYSRLQKERAAQIEKFIESYIENRLPEIIKAKGEKPAKEICEKIKKYFTEVDAKKHPESPIDRVATIYGHLENPNSEAVAEHMKKVIELAFEQHLDNPEQYVSHGFDHTLNVVDYTKSILEANPQIVDAAVEKYGITPGEARFIMENVAIFHDFGYPAVGKKDKAAHGIAGADIISSPEMQKIFGALVESKGGTSGDAQAELFHDLRDSVLFHSADKVEGSYSIKINTTRGTFLTEEGNLTTVISTFHKKEPGSENDPIRTITEIMVHKSKLEETQKQLEVAGIKVIIAGIDEKITPTEQGVVILRVSEQEFKGRSADLASKKDQKLGIEYSEIDLAKNPLQGIIRVADNMDMQASRFTETQGNPIFREVYVALGNETTMGGQVTINIDDADDFFKDYSERVKRGEITEEQATNAKQERMGELKDLLLAQTEITLSSDEIAKIKTPADANKIWKPAFIRSALSKIEGYQTIKDTEEGRKILQIAEAQNSRSIRHFGGCESVRSVELQGSQLVITVDREKFEELNQHTVSEKSIDANGAISEVHVGVGEYQAWRAYEAYRSLSVGGKKIEVIVRNGNPPPEELPTKFNRSI